MAEGVTGEIRKEGGPVLRDVPLVRTEGKKYASGAVWSVDLLLRDPFLQKEHRDQIARDAEKALGLSPSLYFYVGHACPAFAEATNTWVFVFAPDTFDEKPGTMTHFDTGGLFSKKIHLDREVDLAAYCAAHRLDKLSGWQGRFQAYLGEYFTSVGAYVLGERARKDDPEGRHSKNTDRRAWTWEMQLHEDHDVRVGLFRLWLLPDHMDQLKRRIREMEPEAERRRWRSALPPNRLRTPPAVPDETNAAAVCRLAQEDIASCL
jgi:hypothetical protein